MGAFNVLIKSLSRDGGQERHLQEFSPYTNKYGETLIQSITNSATNEESSDLLFTNPTPGTGLVWVTARTTFTDTGPNIYVYNPYNFSTPNFLSFILNYIKLTTTSVATLATSIQYAGILDVGTRVFTTDNSPAISPIRPNSNTPSNVAPLVKVQSSATTSVVSATNTATRRIVCRGSIGGLNIIGDELLIDFAKGKYQSFPPVASAAAQPGRRVSSAPPVIIGPNTSFSFYLWMPGSTASINPQIEISMSCR